MRHLRIASILVILLGVISILAVQLLLGASEAETAAGLSESALKSALAGIVAICAMNIFKIIAGLIMSNKKSLLTVVLGGLLFIIQLAAFFQTGSSIVEIVINIILLVIPYYYFHNAVRNYKDQ